MARTDLKLYPIPGTFLDRALTIPVFGSRADGSQWQEIKAWAAWQFEASEDDVDLSEIYWGGEYGDENNREALTVRGDIVGVFDESLTADEWRELFNADAMQNPRAATAAAPAVFLPIAAE